MSPPDPAGQGLEPGAFDLVIAANVLHATPDVAAAVQRLRTLLAPGGVLLLLEITRHPHWLDIVFGLMDGWWALADRRRRPTHPLMRGSEWRALLDECGFVSTAVIADEADGEPAQSLVVAHRPIDVDMPVAAPAAPTAPGSDGTSLDHLRRRHARRRAAPGGAPARPGRRLQPVRPGTSHAQVAHDLTAHLDRLAGVVHLTAMDAPPMDGLAAFAQAQASGCGNLLDILHGVILGTPLAQRRLVVVTAGAQTTPHDGVPAGPVADAAVGLPAHGAQGAARAPVLLDRPQHRLSRRGSGGARRRAAALADRAGSRSGRRRNRPARHRALRAPAPPDLARAHRRRGPPGAGGPR